MFTFDLPERVRGCSIDYLVDATHRMKWRVTVRCAYHVLSVRGSSLAYLSGHAASSDLETTVAMAVADLDRKIIAENERLSKVVDIPRSIQSSRDADDMLAELGL